MIYTITGPAYVAEAPEAGRQQYASPGHPSSFQESEQKGCIDELGQALEQGQEEGGAMYLYTYISCEFLPCLAIRTRDLLLLLLFTRSFDLNVTLCAQKECFGAVRKERVVGVSSHASVKKVRDLRYYICMWMIAQTEEIQCTESERWGGGGDSCFSIL